MKKAGTAPNPQNTKEGAAKKTAAKKTIAKQAAARPAEKKPVKSAAKPSGDLKKKAIDSGPAKKMAAPKTGPAARGAAKGVSPKAGAAKASTAKAAPKSAVKKTRPSSASKTVSGPDTKGALKKARAAPAKSAARAKTKPAPQNLAEIVFEAAAEHKPLNPVMLDLSGLSSVADWFFILTAENARQMSAIADKIIRRARDHGVRPLGQEGLTGGSWALVDLGDVIIHIFSPEARELYDLEGLWADAPRKSPD